jgi:fructose-1,6-bisphosphatase/inositol monophosphatase family enzyme
MDVKLDLDAVSALLRQVAAEVILPRFGQLTAAEVMGKPTAGDPDDIVTAVDRQAEVRLTAELAGLTPGVPVLGEEAAHERPDLLRLLDGDDPLWVVDPIDGTRNFARGDDGFGVILAFVSQGSTRAAWIFQPARGHLYVAESGGGAFCDGRPVRAPSGPIRRLPRGPLKTTFMPPAMGAAVQAAARGRFEPAPLTGCSATDYPDLLSGAIDFAVYHRLLPWDHAAGTLILTEAGGVAEHVGGARYTPRSSNRPTVTAASAAVAAQILAWLSPVGGLGSM